MAYVVATKPGRFEVRESASTPEGPRSRTLASFRELSAETIEKVQARGEKPPTAAELTHLALRAGAPVRGSELDEATRETLRRIASGERPDPHERRPNGSAWALATEPTHCMICSNWPMQYRSGSARARSVSPA
jgi:hypothetical protein